MPRSYKFQCKPGIPRYLAQRPLSPLLMCPPPPTHECPVPPHCARQASPTRSDLTLSAPGLSEPRTGEWGGGATGKQPCQLAKISAT
jgi:hypothetical protein